MVNLRNLHKFTLVNLPKFTIFYVNLPIFTIFYRISAEINKYLLHPNVCHLGLFYAIVCENNNANQGNQA